MDESRDVPMGTVLALPIFIRRKRPAPKLVAPGPETLRDRPAGPAEDDGPLPAASLAATACDVLACLPRLVTPSADESVGGVPGGEAGPAAACAELTTLAVEGLLDLCGSALSRSARVASWATICVPKCSD